MIYFSAYLFHSDFFLALMIFSILQNDKNCVNYEGQMSS